ncbi:MAG: 1-acyl-sn-glycerol-3-phosphate acyltransferase [Thermodesulfovibrionia bacterium]|nr:1-acyl-sn-glycerol-3-phosphate acyltransferase [Thermodesulfovibrionia bacterium]
MQDNSPKKKREFSNSIHRFITFIIRLICHINGGLNVIGKENIPEEGGVIIASNHVSYLDPLLLGAVIPRMSTFMARKGLFHIPVLGWFIKHYAFPVDREKTLPSTIKNAVTRVKRGKLLIIFPEGRRSETGSLMEGKRGVGMIASLGKVPVIPALIIDSDKALPCGARWLKRAKISVIFGNPLDVSNQEGKGHYLHETVTKNIMYSIGELKKRYEDISG